jgi:hypothetical protein
MEKTELKAWCARHGNGLIIALTVLILAITAMFYWDRQRKRDLEWRRIETQTDVWEEWGPPGRGKQPTKGGKVL